MTIKENSIKMLQELGKTYILSLVKNADTNIIRIYKNNDTSIDFETITKEKMLELIQTKKHSKDIFIIKKNKNSLFITKQLLENIIDNIITNNNMIKNQDIKELVNNLVEYKQLLKNLFSLPFNDFDNDYVITTGAFYEKINNLKYIDDIICYDINDELDINLYGLVKEELNDVLKNKISSVLKKNIINIENDLLNTNRTSNNIFIYSFFGIFMLYIAGLPYIDENTKENLNLIMLIFYIFLGLVIPFFINELFNKNKKDFMNDYEKMGTIFVRNVIEKLSNKLDIRFIGLKISNNNSKNFKEKIKNMFLNMYLGIY